MISNIYMIDCPDGYPLTSGIFSVESAYFRNELLFIYGMRRLDRTQPPVSEFGGRGSPRGIWTDSGCLASDELPEMEKRDPDPPAWAQHSVFSFEKVQIPSPPVEKGLLANHPFSVDKCAGSLER